jgi:phage tail sheath protein FI
LLTSFSDFERIYGGIDQLEFQTGTLTHNYLAHAVRAYFEEGGRRLYVSRVYNSGAAAVWHSGSPPEFELKARNPGIAGNFLVTFQFKLGPNILSTDTATGAPTLQGARNYDVVWAVSGSPSTFEDNLFWVDLSRGRNAIRLRRDDGLIGTDPSVASPNTIPELTDLTSVKILTVSVTMSKMGQFEEDKVWEDLSFHPHPQRRDSLCNVFEPEPVSKRSTSLYVPLVFERHGLNNGATIAEALLSQESLLTEGNSPPGDNRILAHLRSDTTDNRARSFQATLSGGTDGSHPSATQYIGDEDDPKSGLYAFEDIEDISILAAPGSTHSANGELGEQVIRQLISHCEKMRYRVAVLDSTNGDTLGEVQDVRGGIDSTRAAFYYPWVRVFDPVTESEILVPPSGSVAGIYARNDIDRGVHKSPANDVIRQALGFEFLINKAQQEVLNPIGINCLRFFEGRGFRVWGARTASSDPEWKYLNVRRYFAFLERSIERGTQWVVFENNGPVLWENVRTTIEDFLFNEWKENHLLGTTPEQAFFVRCDLTTMTQNDLDNGRLICLIGVAPLRPAEFVIFRIGQKTLDSTS